MESKTIRYFRKKFHQRWLTRTLTHFLANVSILYPFKTPKNQRFSGVFRGYEIGTLSWNVSIHLYKLLYGFLVWPFRLQPLCQKKLYVWNLFTLGLCKLLHKWLFDAFVSSPYIKQKTLRSNFSMSLWNGSINVIRPHRLDHNFFMTEAVIRRCSVEKMFLKISQNSQVFYIFL